MDKYLSKPQALAVRYLSAAEEALIRRDWNAVRDASIKLAALAADRTEKK